MIASINFRIIDKGKFRVIKISKRRRFKSSGEAGEAKTVELQGVGSIQMERSRRAKHISVSVRPYTGAGGGAGGRFICQCRIVCPIKGGMD